MTHQTALRAAVSATRAMLLRPTLNAAKIQSVYKSHFGKKAFPTPVAKSRPQFSKDVYPPLLDNPLGLSEIPKGLPKWTSAKELLALAATEKSILARILAAYIWKRGELGRVRHVREGILAAMGKGITRTGGPADAAAGLSGDMEGPVVMWQFGRHLAMGGDHPIFDQHTYRAFLILSRGVQPPKTLQLRVKHLNEYLNWWSTVATKHLPGRDSVDRPAATYTLDKLLFSIGKAALLCPASYPRPVRKQKPRSLSGRRGGRITIR